MDTTHPSKLTSPSTEFFPLIWHFIYSVLVILSQKPFDSKIYLHNSSFWLTPILLSSINTTSSAKSIHQEISPCMSFVFSFITKVKIYGLNADPWCNSILIENVSDSPSHALTQVTTFVYIYLIRVTYFVGTSFLLNAYHMIFLGILSYTFSKSINIICRSFFCSWCLSISYLIKKIASIVDLSFIKPNWFLETIVSFLKRCSITLFQSFMVWFMSLIHL
jgi:hypothetical protein